jgi:hypothetical protein
VKVLEATIKLEYDDEKTATAVAAAISPENVKAPKGLFIQTLREGCCVITVIKAEEKLATFISTIDDLLSSASTAEKMVLSIKKSS